MALSTTSAAPFAFHDPPIDLAAMIPRPAFERWIAGEVATISACVDGLLARCAVRPATVGAVFLTGGSAFVPAVRRLFAERFDERRLRGGDELTSVAKGLALLAANRGGAPGFTVGPDVG